MILDDLVKSPYYRIFVIPAKAGIRYIPFVLDPAFQGGRAFSTFYDIIILRENEKALSPFEYLLRIAADADPMRGGFQAQPMYIFLNIAVPVILGILLGSLIKIIEKMLRIRTKRGE